MKNNRFVRIIPLLFLICFPLQAQRIGQWKSYMAYQNANLVAETPHFIFAVYDGSLLSYSTDDQEIATYSFEDGLSDVGIKYMAYCSELNALVLVYNNSNIDLFFGRNNVFNLADIKNDSYLTDKAINNLYIIGRYAYVCTAFGIVVIDIDRKEIKSTYRLDVNTRAMCFWGDSLYAATSEGICRALVSSNLLDKANWEYLPAMDGNYKTITQMTVFKERLVVYDSFSLFYIEDGKFNWLFSDNCRQLLVANNQLVCGVVNGVLFYDDFDHFTVMYLTDEFRQICLSSTSAGHYWIAWGNKGVLELITRLEGNELKYDEATSGIKINSPLRNLNFYMTYASNQLLIVGGNRGANRLNVPGTLMIYENGKWTNFDNNAIAAKTGLGICDDFMSVAVDPRDPHHYFVASWGEGVYEFQDTAFVRLYSLDNSQLQSALPNSDMKMHFVRVDGLAFDQNNNLYMVNASAPNGLVVMDKDNKWMSFSYPPLLNSQPNQLIVTRNNQKWVNNFRVSIGIFVLDDNNTIDNANDDTYYYSTQFADQRGTDIKATTYSCLAEDLDGTVWVGTDNGPIYFTSAEQVRQGVCNRIILSDQYEAGYYPMEGQRITTIAIDGGNRKWIGTSGGGVFVVDGSGETIQIENFTKSNSPLISDNISSIAINNQTGEVFIGTDLGLVSYQGDAVEGKPDYSNVYAFPNPVFPARNSQVIITGLMGNSTIKITDVAGNLIQEAVSKGGQYNWNCTNLKGETVKAGIYLVFAATSDGSQGVVTKIMVIK
ncbi:MAG: hypothetical protein FWF52_05385 [Candidatus Azobacteroides sp.]|nr:hypothetical protein [Candidatus Azobacteroides sp.]